MEIFVRFLLSNFKQKWLSKYINNIIIKIHTSDNNNNIVYNRCHIYPMILCCMGIKFNK